MNQVTGKILVVDDEKGMRDFLSILLRKEGHQVAAAANGAEAIELMGHEIFDLIITDVKMPSSGGMEVLKAAREASPGTIVLMITAYASPENAIEAMKEGAYDYLTKPFRTDEVRLIVQKALEKRLLEKENLRLRRELSGTADFSKIIGRSPRMQKVLQLIAKVADSASNILILGESGTGKELVARAIHFNSSRRDKPFVTVNCSALPEPLLESELFGHMKGSFTGAVANKEGLFELADQGTIFLDEIGETPLGIQVKLLRVLQEREFRRIGGTKDIRVDVRVIAATNKDLQREVQAGKFREDLFYRLDVIPIHLPPLREHREDIPRLVEHFLARFGAASGKEVPGVHPEAMRMLLDHDWKGNVRELENVIERVMTLSSGQQVQPEHLQESLQRRPGAPNAFAAELPPEGVDLEAMVAKFEKDLMLQALARTRWMKKEAAKLLGLNFRSFRYRVEKYGIRRPGQEPRTESPEADESSDPGQSSAIA